MNLHSRIIDIVTAFLEPHLDKEIYMKCPEGYDKCDPNRHCLLLLKTIYGLVQSARRWFLKVVEIFEGLGFKQNRADPCLFTLRRDGMVIYICVYVDDFYMVGHTELIEWTTSKLEKILTIKIPKEDEDDYLSCKLRKIEEGFIVKQPHLIKNLRNTFLAHVSKKQRYMTPGTPHKGIIRPKEEERSSDIMLSANDQSKYRTGVGMLLFLVKHSRPDLSNSVRELSKVMDGATMAAQKELHRVIKFALDTSNRGLKISPTTMMEGTNEVELKAYTDSEYSGDPDNRISVSGMIIFLQNSPVMWRSKAQRSVTLSTAEAEYVALSEATADVIFLKQVLEEMGLTVKLPISVYVDNVGAMFMVENPSTTGRAKHVNIRYHFVREYVRDGIIKVEFVRSGENLADGFTKNVNRDIYWNHSDQYMSDIDDEEENDKSDIGTTVCDKQEGCRGMCVAQPSVTQDRSHMGVTSTRDHVLGLMSLSEDRAPLNDICSAFMDCDTGHNMLDWSHKIEISRSTYGVDHMPMAYDSDTDDETVSSCDDDEQDQCRTRAVTGPYTSEEGELEIEK